MFVGKLVGDQRPLYIEMFFLVVRLAIYKFMADGLERQNVSVRQQTIDRWNALWKAVLCSQSEDLCTIITVIS